MSQHVIENNPLSKNISSSDNNNNNNSNNNHDIGATQNGTQNFKRKTKKSNNQNCNAPGAMIAYSQYAQVIHPTRSSYSETFC